MFEDLIKEKKKKFDAVKEKATIRPSEELSECLRKIWKVPKNKKKDYERFLEEAKKNHKI